MPEDKTIPAEEMREIFDEVLTDMSIDFAKKQANVPAVKAGVLLALNAAGVTVAGVSYEGYGDSGLITEVTASKNDGSSADLSQEMQVDLGADGSQRCTLKESLEAFACF